jgi:chemotaxis protein methyltransferase WspC
VSVAAKQVEALLRRKIGLHVESIGAGAFDRAVRERMAACRMYSEDAYLGYLLEHPAELERLIEQVVVHESWFFREPASLEFLCARASATARGPARPFRVLSVPCASGEEPYSIAIMLLLSGLAPDGFEIHAVDVSAPALDAARRGLYSEYAFRGALDRYAAYLEPRGSGMQVIAAVRELVTFSQGNVLDPVLLPGVQFDAVLCRNLLIYLDAESRAGAMRNLMRWLADEGALFTGHAESNIALEHGLRKLGDTRCFAFERMKQQHTPPAGLRPLRSAPAAASPERPRTPAFGTPVVARAQAVTQHEPRRPAPSPRPVPPARPGLEEARALADRGDLIAARALCEAHLASAGPDAAAYCLLAVVKQAAGDLDGAVDAFGKALYLDADHLDALFHLALLHERRGNREAANTVRKRAARAQRRRNA